MNPAVSVRVVYWENLEERTLSEAALEAEAILHELDSILAGINDALLLAVSDNHISELKTAGAVEFIFAKPHLFTVSLQVVEAHKLLIPLTATAADSSQLEPAVIYWGERKYSAGPFLSTRSTKILMRLVCRQLQEPTALE